MVGPGRGRALAALLVLVGVLTCAAPAAASAAKSSPTPPLSHDGRWITDADGRVVVLHGWNMVYKVGSYRPADAGFSADDMRFLHRNGFNLVRLGIIQNGVEPKLPTDGRRADYRERYLKSLSHTQLGLQRHGIFTLLDAHQDMYNPRFQGEGFPDWAVVGDAATLPAEPALGFPANYLAMPALSRAFDHFWANDRDAAGRPLQNSFAAMWRHIAANFGKRAGLLGYNLLNEPWPGSTYESCISTIGCPAFDKGTLQPFIERVLGEIRKRDPSSLVFWAPLLTFDFGADTSVGRLGDPNTAMGFNLYCLPVPVPGAPPVTCQEGYGLTLSNADKQARQTGDGLLMTEFGATDDLGTITDVERRADKHMVGWTQWHYCECDDPTTSGTGVQSVVGDARKPPHGDNLNRAKLAASARPYPQLVAGTPTGWSFDPGSGRFQLRYSTKTPAGKRLGRRKLSEVFLPPIHYHGRYQAKVDGARVVSRPGARRLLLERNRGARSVSLVVTPRG